MHVSFVEWTLLKITYEYIFESVKRYLLRLMKPILYVKSKKTILSVNINSTYTDPRSHPPTPTHTPTHTHTPHTTHTPTHTHTPIYILKIYKMVLTGDIV